MSIISSTVTSDRDQGTYRKITCNHVDHLAVTHIERWKSLPAENIEVTKLDHATAYDSMLAENEIQQWIADINNGLDPAHIPMGDPIGTYFVNSEPVYNTWAIAVDGAVTPFLQSELREGILPIKDLWGRLTNKEGEGIAGKPNDVAAELANEVNAQTDRDAYIALIDEQENPRL